MLKEYNSWWYVKWQCPNETYKIKMTIGKKHPLRHKLWIKSRAQYEWGEKTSTPTQKKWVTLTQNTESMVCPYNETLEYQVSHHDSLQMSLITYDSPKVSHHDSLEMSWCIIWLSLCHLNESLILSVYWNTSYMKWVKRLRMDMKWVKYIWCANQSKIS